MAAFASAADDADDADSNRRVSNDSISDIFSSLRRRPSPVPISPCNAAGANGSKLPPIHKHRSTLGHRKVRPSEGGGAAGLWNVIPNELCSEGSRDGNTRLSGPRSLVAKPLR